jgi:hypothetical protein
MTLDDISDLLALCANYDGRQVTENTAPAWLLLLEDIPAGDGASAVREHYRTSTKWIMPADIVAHHEKLVAGRVVEQARMSPPKCWGRGCDVQYVTSQVPGSHWAYPDKPHAAGCNAMQGLLEFTPEGRSRLNGAGEVVHDGPPTWSVMPEDDPAGFDELAYAAEQQRMAEALDRGGTPWALPPGPVPDLLSRLAVEPDGEIVD